MQFLIESKISAPPHKYKHLEGSPTRVDSGPYDLQHASQDLYPDRPHILEM